MRWWFATVIACGFAGNLAAQDQPVAAYDPVDAYRDERLHGWPLKVHRELYGAEKNDLRQRTLRLLDDHLYRIVRVLPADSVEAVRGVPIWIEVAHPRHKCMCYHPSADWLRTHGMNPAKAKGVEIANCENFLAWTHDQPWMVLHELAHAYHDQVLDFENESIRRCYDRAVEQKLYDKVLRINGKDDRHYALNNPKEYFAEMTEAYFGTNDFFPFVRAELKRHDPEMFEAVRQAWKVK